MQDDQHLLAVTRWGREEIKREKEREIKRERERERESTIRQNVDMWEIELLLWVPHL